MGDKSFLVLSNFPEKKIIAYFYVNSRVVLKTLTLVTCFCKNVPSWILLGGPEHASDISITTKTPYPKKLRLKMNKFRYLN